MVGARAGICSPQAGGSQDAGLLQHPRPAPSRPPRPPQALRGACACALMWRRLRRVLASCGVVEAATFSCASQASQAPQLRYLCYYYFVWRAREVGRELQGEVSVNLILKKLALDYLNSSLNWLLPHGKFGISRTSRSALRNTSTSKLFLIVCPLCAPARGKIGLVISRASGHLPVEAPERGHSE